MTIKITAQMTPQGLLIPKAALANWSEDELEVVQEQEAIIIRPKGTSSNLRHQVRQILGAAGLLYQPDWETPPDLSAEERARLAKKLGEGQPLSEMIISDRDDRA